MSVRSQNRSYTPEQYLELEERSEVKHEYRNGEIVEMTGGTTNHNTIIINLCAYLKFALRGTQYKLYASDVRLWIPNYSTFTYPDIMLVAGDPIYYGTGTTTVTNPIAIVEVLSKSTQSYDCGEKFQYYRSLPSFQEYIAIDQYAYRIDRYCKAKDNRWILTEYNDLEKTLPLATIDFEIAIADLYEGVNF